MTPEHERIARYAGALGLDVDVFRGVADALGAGNVAQAMLECSDNRAAIKSPAAWVRWRAAQLQADGIRAADAQAVRSRSIDLAAKARKDESIRAARAAEDDQAFYESMPALVREEFLALVLAQMDPMMRTRLKSKTAETSPILRGMVIATARKAGFAVAAPAAHAR